MISGLPRRWDSLKETFDMIHEYDLNIRKMIKPMKVALQHPGKALPFILQVVRHGSGPSLKYTYKKMLETKTGGEMAYKNEEISQYLPSLSERPEGSVGQETYNYFGRHRENVQKASRRTKINDEWVEAKHPYSWMARRYRDTHDIWHILTGYPTSTEGEMCIAMFSFAQTRSIAWLIIGVGVILAILNHLRHPLKSFAVFKMAYEAYRNGKRAKFLLAENYDELLSENLDSARERLNIRLPKAFVNRSPNFLKL
jgi:ubiquinone biosynthesis protein COQ4